MKRFIAIILAAMLVATLSIGAFAATVDQDSTPPTGSTDISYEVDPTYTVTIPATVTLGNNATVSADDVIVEEGKQVTVKLTATSGAGNAFTLSNGNTGTITYEVKKNTTAIYIGDVVLAINPSTDDSGSATLNFASITPVPQFAGTYTGTVTFTVAVENIIYT